MDGTLQQQFTPTLTLTLSCTQQLQAPPHTQIQKERAVAFGLCARRDHADCQQCSIKCATITFLAVSFKHSKEEDEEGEDWRIGPCC